MEGGGYRMDGSCPRRSVDTIQCVKSLRSSYTELFLQNLVILHGVVSPEEEACSGSVGSEGRRGRLGTPTMALHIRIQHQEETDNEACLHASDDREPTCRHDPSSGLCL